MNNPYRYPFEIMKEDRRRLNRHKSYVLWLTGLSGAGKTTLASMLEKEMHSRSIRSFILDGDILRQGLNKDLTFTEEDRKENMRRVGEVAKLFVEAGIIVIAALISPFRAEREMVRALFDPEEFIEIYVQCPLEECERRDRKGLYKKARAGIIKDFTGVTMPYEPPINPEFVVETAHQPPERTVGLLIEYLESRKILESNSNR